MVGRWLHSGSGLSQGGNYQIRKRFFVFFFWKWSIKFKIYSTTLSILSIQEHVFVKDNSVYQKREKRFGAMGFIVSTDVLNIAWKYLLSYVNTLYVVEINEISRVKAKVQYGIYKDKIQIAFIHTYLVVLNSKL